MMAARYKHELGPEDATFCVHCGQQKRFWPDNVCKLKPNLTAEEIETELDAAPKLKILDADESARIWRRDQNATAALTGLLSAQAHPESGGVHSQPEGIADQAKLAYKYADAMEEARNEQTSV